MKGAVHADPVSLRSPCGRALLVTGHREGRFWSLVPMVEDAVGAVERQRRPVDTAGPGLRALLARVPRGAVPAAAHGHGPAKG